MQCNRNLIVTKQRSTIHLSRAITVSIRVDRYLADKYVLKKDTNSHDFYFSLPYVQYTKNDTLYYGFYGISWRVILVGHYIDRYTRIVIITII